MCSVQYFIGYVFVGSMGPGPPGDPGSDLQGKAFWLYTKNSIPDLPEKCDGKKGKNFEKKVKPGAKTKKRYHSWPDYDIKVDVQIW